MSEHRTTSTYWPLTPRQKPMVGTALFVLALLLIDCVHHLYFSASNLDHIASWLTGTPIGGDSWFPMRRAYQFLIANPDASLYQTIFFDQQDKFQYPPSSLLLYAAGNAVGSEMGNRLLNAGGWVSVATEIIAVAGIAVLTALRAPNGPKDRQSLWMIAAVTAVATVTFYPVAKAYSVGQIQAWLNAWFALACAAFLLDRRMIAGALIGAICIFKPQLGLFLIWAALRKEWNFILGWIAVILPAAIASLAVFGFENHWDYLSVLSFLSQHGEAYYPNQSFNGLLHRLLGNGDNLNWQEHGFPPYSVIVHIGTIATSLALIAGALVYRARAASTTVIDFLIAGLSFTIASPIAWEHHYGILPVAFAVLWTLWASNHRTSISLVEVAILALSFMFASRFWPSLNLLADTPVNVLQSYLYLSALGLVWLLYRERDLVPSASQQPRRLI